MQRPITPAPESGNALIELAITLPLFALLILGGAEIANIAWASVQVNNAARAGASFGSLSRTNAADITNIELAAQNEAPKLTLSFPTPPTQVCYCVTGGTPGAPDIGCANTNLTTCALPSVIQVAVQVSVQAPVTPLVHYPGLPSLYTVRARATVGVEQ
jgi:Flp pilus assembly protein TadG